jgi:hypothetical protein
MLFRRRYDELARVLEQVQRTLDQLERRAEKMETILFVREPSSVSSAEAYEGLRKQVVNAVTERLNHLTQLVQLDHALRHGADAPTLRTLVDGWFEQAGLVRVDDPEHGDRDLVYDLLEAGDGPLVVTEPAYVDAVSGRLIRPGRARRRPTPDRETS